MKNIFKINGFIFLMAIIMFSILGCDNGRGSGKLRNINIVGAKALMIAPAGSMARSARTNGIETVLLKQLDDGSWVQVRMTDEEDAEVRTQPPVFIHDATENWIIIGFLPDNIHSYDQNGIPIGSDEWGNLYIIDEKYYSYYIVNKLNGEAFDLTPIGVPQIENLGKKMVYADKNGFLYIYNRDKNYQGNNRIAKVTIGSTQATAQMITNETLAIGGFNADIDGNVFYFQWNSVQDSWTVSYRVRTADGTILPVNLGEGEFDPFSFTGLDGNIYISKPDSSPFYNQNLYKLEITGNTADDIVINPVEFDIVSGYSSEMKLIYTPDKIYAYDSSVHSGFSEFFSIDKNGNAECVNLSQNIPYSEISVGTNAFYAFTGTSILKIDTETGAVSTKVSSSDYDAIYRFDVGGNDIIILNALTFDGKKALVQIYPDGTKETLSENLNETETLILQKVN